MKKKGKLALGILQFGLVVGFAGAVYATTQNSLQPVTVYKLTQDVPLNSKIGLSDFKKTTIPKDAFDEEMVTDPTELVDLHASTNLFADQYAVEDMFVEVDKVDPFEINDLTGLRKISVPASYVDSMGGNLKYGDKVDLVFIGEGENKDGSAYNYARTFIQGALVYSVTTDDGYRFLDHSERAEGQVVAAKDEEVASNEEAVIEPGDLAQVTLAVTPAQAEEISARLSSGKIQLVGRFDESKDAESAGFVIGEYEAQFTGQGLPETNK